MKKSGLQVKSLIYVPLFVIPIIVYFSVTGHQFLTSWDDAWMVLNNYTIGGLSFSNIGKIFSESNQGQYSPLNQLIYNVIYIWFGSDPFFFHLTSVLWHAINVCLVYAFVKSLFGLRENGGNVKLIQITAFLTALLFAVHPVNTEAVAWISASKIPLYTLFGLSGLLCYMRYLKSGKKRWLAVTFVLFVLSFLSKEQAIIIPFVMPLIDWFAGRNLWDKKLWIEKIPFLALALTGGFYTLTLRNIDLVEYRAGYPLWQRMVFACYAITEYLTKLIVPLKLMYLYPFPMAPGELLPHRFFLYPVIVAFIVGLLIYYRKYKVLVFSALFFLLNVSLTLHIISMSRSTIVADRYIYLSCIGFFAPTFWYGAQYVMRLSKYKKIFACILFGAYLLCLTGYTIKHSEVWHNNDTLKKEVRELLDKRKEETAYLVHDDELI